MNLNWRSVTEALCHAATLHLDVIKLGALKFASTLSLPFLRLSPSLLITPPSPSPHPSHASTLYYNNLIHEAGWGGLAAPLILTLINPAWSRSVYQIEIHNLIEVRASSRQNKSLQPRPEDQ